ncbi:hypothetical protein V6N11_002002 [Hibiscus sabdariffa]|uniref:Uncharacterized protein n=1 Tax=Hibiscus sabdariffa TaxID=183260 RepID=A0ABR2QU60_9ROSI
MLVLLLLQIGYLSSDGISSGLHESLQEMSLPEHEPQQDLSLPTECSIEPHTTLPMSVANKLDPQELNMPAMHSSDAQPGLSLPTDESVFNASNQLHQQGQVESGNS